MDIDDDGRRLAEKSLEVIFKFEDSSFVFTHAPFDIEFFGGSDEEKGLVQLGLSDLLEDEFLFDFYDFAYRYGKAEPITNIDLSIFGISVSGQKIPLLLVDCLKGGLALFQSLNEMEVKDREKLSVLVVYSPSVLVTMFVSSF